jgi:uncharacterized secreted protein with C-terminal beta-propeller domain
MTSTQFVGILAVALIIIIGVAAFVTLVLQNGQQEKPSSELQIKKFSSYSELSAFLSDKASYSYGAIGAFSGAPVTTGAAREGTAESGAKADDYSTTNIQVAGVDEADIVKNDGKYAYIVSSLNSSIIIADVWPAGNAQIVSQILIEGNPENIFVNGDRLVVLGSSGYSGCLPGLLCYAEGLRSYYYSPTAFIYVYDITDRSNPILKNNITMDGSYYDSRMIDNWAYVIINSQTGYNENVTMPNITHNGAVTTLKPEDVYYYDIVDSSYRFTTILGISLSDDASEPSRKTLLTGWTEDTYVSQNKIYLTYKKQINFYDYTDEIIDGFRLYMPASVADQIDTVLASDKKKSEKWMNISSIMSDWMGSMTYEERQRVENATRNVYYDIMAKMVRESDKTMVYGISVSAGQIDFSASGEVPGQVLNQFSMDEYNGYFRIATTTTEVPVVWTEFSQATTRNNVYVLDSALAVTGKLEGLAPGESIYSARFIEDRAYLVTFQRVDPLFVIDLSSPTAPAVLGQLKIPGFSDYLHPYDSTHIIGIGKETSETVEGRIIPAGVKLALFDVSDVSNPTEVSKYVIGNQSTYSEALNDHKAFLFSKSKELLVIPIADWSWSDDQQKDVVNGAYVFRLTIDAGFELRGTVSHPEKEGEWGHYVYRSFYIDNVLYTLSDSMLKANSLVDLSDIKTIELPSYAMSVVGKGI